MENLQNNEEVLVERIKIFRTAENLHWRTFTTLIYTLHIGIFITFFTISTLLVCSCLQISLSIFTENIILSFPDVSNGQYDYFKKSYLLFDLLVSCSVFFISIIHKPLKLYS
jgi:hypothetical protein